MKKNIYIYLFSLLTIASCSRFSSNNDSSAPNNGPPSPQLPPKTTPRKVMDPIGLQNDGNHCYLNVVIQTLANSSSANKYFESKTGSKTEGIMGRIIKEYHKMQQSPLSSSHLGNLKRKLVAKIFPGVDPYKQQCSLESMEKISMFTQPTEVIYDLKTTDIEKPVRIDTGGYANSSKGENYIIKLTRYDASQNKVFTPIHIPTKIKRNGINYKLSSVIFHIGSSIKGGHYTSLIITNNEPFYCNDSSVTDGTQILNELKSTGSLATDHTITPYLLYYDKE